MLVNYMHRTERLGLDEECVETKTAHGWGKSQFIKRQFQLANVDADADSMHVLLCSGFVIYTISLLQWNQPRNDEHFFFEWKINLLERCSIAPGSIRFNGPPPRFLLRPQEYKINIQNGKWNVTSQSEHNAIRRKQNMRDYGLQEQCTVQQQMKTQTITHTNTHKNEIIISTCHINNNKNNKINFGRACEGKYTNASWRNLHNWLAHSNVETLNAVMFGETHGRASAGSLTFPNKVFIHFLVVACSRCCCCWGEGGIVLSVGFRCSKNWNLCKILIWMDEQRQSRWCFGWHTIPSKNDAHFCSWGVHTVRTLQCHAILVYKTNRIHLIREYRDAGEHIDR